MRIPKVQLKFLCNESPTLTHACAKVDWSDCLCTLTTSQMELPAVEYEVHAYLVHVRDQHISVNRGMCQGHYVAYFRHDNVWYKADDSSVSRLPSQPTDFP